MKETERKPTSSDALRVRCPYCRKLYMVQFNDVVEARPRFECVECRTRFWLSLPDMDLTSELTGIPIQIKTPPAPATPAPAAAVKKEPCPKCFQANPVGATECGHCGVVFEKIREVDFIESRITPPRTESLALAWKKVVSNYGEESLHDGFLRMAEREGHLPYAGHQYAQMRKLMPNDEITLKRLSAVQALGLQMLPKPEPRVERKPFARVWQMFLVAATLTMAVGFCVPMLRNVIGVGALLLFIAIVTKLQSQPR